MSITKPLVQPDPSQNEPIALIQQYGCGPIHYSKADEGLNDRHLLFDNVMHLDAAGPREWIEAFASSVHAVSGQLATRVSQR